MTQTKETSQLVSELVFLQGDDANKVFGVMYPPGNSTGKHDKRNIINLMLEFTSDDLELVVREYEALGASGVFTTKHYILVWNYAYNWVALYLKVTKKMHKEMMKEKELVTV